MDTWFAHQPNSWFDLKALRDCAYEKGDDLRMCKKGLIQEARPEYGVPAEYGWSCRKLEGWVVSVKLSAIAINQGAGTVKDSEENAYIFPINFSPKEVDETTYFWVNGRFSQVELVYVCPHRHNVILYYQYRLIETNKTIDADINSIVELPY
jgi:hypothetical protein